MKFLILVMLIGLVQSVQLDGGGAGGIFPSGGSGGGGTSSTGVHFSSQVGAPV